MTYPMDMDRLKTLLGAYGASPSRWPASERDAAEAMIASSDEARGVFAEASRLDALLDRAAPAPPVDRLGWRLRGIGPRAEPPIVATARRGIFAPSNLARAAAVVLAIAAGVAVGIALPGDRAAPLLAGNDAATELARASEPALAGLYEDAGLQDGDGLVTLAGYTEDGLSLPLQ